MMANFTTTKRLYLTEDDRIVEDGDPAARWLFAAAGTEITEADAIKYGLMKAKKSQEPRAETVETKAVDIPVEVKRSPINKARPAAKKKRSG